MRIELGWFYIYIGRDGIHIELEKYPHFWLTFSIHNSKAWRKNKVANGV